jgi:uncharacterized membrane protein
VPPAPTSQPLARVLRLGLLAFAAAAPVVALLGWLVDGSAGVLGALLGLALPAAFFGVTALVDSSTRHLPPSTTGAVVLVSWLVKLVVLVIVMIAVDTSSAWSRPVFGVVFLLATVAWLALEAWLVIRTRQPYVVPAPSGPGQVTGSTPTPSNDA